MGYFFLAIAALGALFLAAHAFTRSNPAALAQTLRLGIGYSALILAGIFALTGRLAFAIPLGMLAMSLLGRGFSLPGGFPGRGRPSPGQVSRVRTATLEMTLDHDTGEIDGTVLAGAHAGERLNELGIDNLIRLRQDCSRNDHKAMQLLEAYLDQAHEGWRKLAGAGDAKSGPGHGSDGGPMTREEAYAVLGVEPGAGKDEIRRAHRQLMKKLHPDQGGSTYLAAKVNEAKDLLLSV